MAPDALPMDTPGYDIFAIPTPPSPSDVLQYREARLRSLQTDPDNFFPTHAQEVLFTDDMWRSRLSGTDSATFVARPHGSDAGSGPFVGMVSMHPAQASPLPLPVADADPKTAYFAMAMWVAPEHRQRGLGRALLEASLAWADRDALRATPGADGGETKADVFLCLAAENVTGRRLYEKLGFEPVATTTVPGRRGQVQWMRRWVRASDFGAPTVT